MLVLVKSAIDYVNRRNSVRETWGRISHIENVALHVVFVVGMAEGDRQERLEEESEKEGDVLQFIGVDVYRYIAFKVLAGMQWARDNMPQSMLYSTADDDLIPNLPRFVKLLRKHVHRAHLESNVQSNFNLPIICVHAYRIKAIPVRLKDGEFGKYYLDPKEFPMDFFPPFCFGGWYVMSYARVKRIYEESRKERAIQMDDIWITGILRIKVHPSSIEPIDAFQKIRGFGLLNHFEGDYQVEKNITGLMRKSWGNIWNDVIKLPHCTRR